MRRYGLLIVGSSPFTNYSNYSPTSVSKGEELPKSGILLPILSDEANHSLVSGQSRVVCSFSLTSGSQVPVEGPFSTRTFLLKNLLYLSFFTFNLSHPTQQQQQPASQPASCQSCGDDSVAAGAAIALAATASQVDTRQLFVIS